MANPFHSLFPFSSESPADVLDAFEVLLDAGYDDTVTHYALGMPGEVLFVYPNDDDFSVHDGVVVTSDGDYMEVEVPHDLVVSGYVGTL